MCWFRDANKVYEKAKSLEVNLFANDVTTPTSLPATSSTRRQNRGDLLNGRLGKNWHHSRDISQKRGSHPASHSHSPSGTATNINPVEQC
ncbi:hypothetical protein F441_12834 [Phytophthora nicotianae CJ01A1]|uniref:Uncharacterized protein n=1 Tax=Phytophthora nicotianae CJ01A1 TaxID=1317063 RepID=W2WQ30_PHYNI|nr:hypothetical protein F441_12834 [Phytophthora nicotianae CJ01A1]